VAPAASNVLLGPWSDESLARLSDGEAEVYLHDGDALSAANALMAMRHAGIDAPLWGGPSLARAQLPVIAGDAASGACYAITAPLRADLSLGSSFVRGYQELAGVMPGPWAALAYDAANLLLDALEQEIAARGRPVREGVTARLEGMQGPDGQPVFVQGQRRHPEIAFYCYGEGGSYPGRLSSQ
jgi:ABC-type branched-subunit amino acid transport system substrate-binding protein